MPTSHTPEDTIYDHRHDHPMQRLGQTLNPETFYTELEGEMITAIEHTSTPIIRLCDVRDALRRKPRRKATRTNGKG